SVLRNIQATQDTYTHPPARYTNPDFVRKSASHTAQSLYGVVGVLVAVGLLIVGFRYFPARGMLVGCVVLEMVVFALGARPSSIVRRAVPPAWEAVFRQHPGNYRVMFASQHEAVPSMTR